MTHPLSTRLHRFIITHYDRKEFRTLCFDLDVEYDDLGGEGRSDKARELVRHVERRRQLPQLSNLLRQTRPDLFEQAGLSSFAAALNAPLEGRDQGHGVFRM